MRKQEIKNRIFALFGCYSMFLACYAQEPETVYLPYEEPETFSLKNKEKAYFHKKWNTPVIINVNRPSIQIFKPTTEKNTGTAVIVAPGGALHKLSIKSEGTDVANWLTSKGITAFVLKYRLVPTIGDGDTDSKSFDEETKFLEAVAKVMPYSVSDALQAISHVRTNAGTYNIDPAKIGFLGFSAGGAVVMEVANAYKKESRPDFLVPVYPWTTVTPVREPKKDAPPIFIVCASDDGLGLAGGSIALYSAWQQQEISAELHMFARGGHGFGMRVNNLPSDKWIQYLYDWLGAENFR